MKFTQMAKSQRNRKILGCSRCKGKVFGRIITEVATILRGKNKPCFTPNVDYW